MSTDSQPASNSGWVYWLGWIITLLPVAGLIMSGVVKIVGLPEGSPDIGWRMSSLIGLAIIELGCLAIYLYSPTAILGAILLTGYLGGAVATHVRMGDAFLPPIGMGVLLWVGLLLRDERLQALFPWRGDPSAPAAGGAGAVLAKIGLTFAAIVFVVIALIVAQPTEYRVSRSTTIAAPASEIYPHVNDFHKWKAWTPWLEDDPNAKVTIDGSAGKGATYKWAGNDQVGEGKMTMSDGDLNERVRIKLEFVRPMEGKADVEFTFKADGKKTIVTWTTTGERNLLGKAFGSFMSMGAMIGSRFEKGLANLKSIAEGKK
ncbi:MAG: SRPBCC family protein [Planctomycetes bacterium]|nr:SRPBCC family protein [Planctomycetota bacterium]